MGLCQVCKTHVMKRFREKMPLINLTRENLKSMTTDQLERLLTYVKQGVMVCKDCRHLCHIGDEECTPVDKERFKQGRAYNFRMMEDERTIEKITTELKYREIFYRKNLNKLAPKAPTHDIS